MRGGVGVAAARSAVAARGVRAVGVWAGCALLLLAGCAPPPWQPEPEPVLLPPTPPWQPEPEPVLLPPTPPVEEVARPDEALPPYPRYRAPERTSPLAGEGGERVTFTAVDADVRSLLTLLAEAAGVDLVLGPEVEGRVSIAFEDVPARLALMAVLREAGLEVREPLEAPWGPVVFYDVPVNVDRASAETIARRFGVSDELAEWLVEARIPPRR